MPTPPAHWAATLFGLLILGAFTWLVAPLIAFQGRAPLAPLPYRLLAVAFVVGLWVLGGLGRRILARRRNTHLIRALLGSVLDPEENARNTATYRGIGRWNPIGALRTLRQARREERASRLGQVGDYLRAKGGGFRSRSDAAAARRYDFERAILTLSGGYRRGLLTKTYLSELPWYLVLGPAEAGKRTLLDHLGLDLFSPTAHAGRPLPGVGAAQGCRWHFSSDATLVEVGEGASGPAGDDWLAIPDALAEARGVPVNGVLALYSAAALMDPDPRRREVLTRGLKERLRALQGRYRTNVPIYLIVTQADRIGGFAEFFADVGGARRRSPWGVRFACPSDQTLGAALGAAFDELVDALRAQRPARMEAAATASERTRVLAFPEQLAALRAPAVAAAELLAAAEPGQDPVPLLVRGVYLTSTRGGTEPDEPLVRSIANRLELGPALLPPGPRLGRALFCSGLVRDLLPADAHIAARHQGRERRRDRLRAVALMAAAVLIMGTAAALGFGAWQGSRALDQVQNRLEEYHHALVAGLADPKDTALLPALNAMRATLAAVPTRGAWYSAAERPAAGRLRAEAHAAYRRLLGNDFLGRILTRFETRVQAPSIPPAEWRTNAELYLMLGDLIDPDAGRLKRELTARWKEELPARELADLIHHLDALLRRPLPLQTLDDRLVEAINRRFYR